MMHGPDHALRSQFKVGMKVYFGRKRGEKTLGEIVKMNPRKAKVKQLEDRGSIRDYPVGTLWTVPFTLLTPADPKASFSATVPVQPAPVKQPLKYNPFAGLDNLFLEALAQAYSGLEPENLSCDGEASMAHINQQRAYLNRVIKGCKLALNRDDLDESDVFAWEQSRREYQRQHQKQA